MRVLDLRSGRALCEGDLRVSFKTDSTTPGFIMSQALPMGVLLPACGKPDGFLCREASHYAQLTDVAPAPAAAAVTTAMVRPAVTPARKSTRASPPAPARQSRSVEP